VTERAYRHSAFPHLFFLSKASRSFFFRKREIASLLWFIDNDTYFPLFSLHPSFPKSRSGCRGRSSLPWFLWRDSAVRHFLLLFLLFSPRSCWIIVSLSFLFSDGSGVRRRVEMRPLNARSSPPPPNQASRPLGLDRTVLLRSRS